MFNSQNSAPIDTIATQHAIVLHDVVHQYDGNRSNQAGLHFKNWSVESGQQIFLHGDSGSGKSTLLNLLSGILTPQQGNISLFGTDIGTLSNSQRDRFRAKNIGVVFQQFNLIPYLTVVKNIELAVYLAKATNRNLREDLKQLASSLNLPESILDSPVANLSVGQQQRIAIMRAFINSPKLLLIDEPTSALDASAKNAFMTQLTALCQQHQTTMIFVSHDDSLKEFFSVCTPISSFCQPFSIQGAR